MAYKIGLYPERWETLKDLSFEDKGKILECIFEYDRIRSIPFDGHIAIIFGFMKNRFDIDKLEYESKCLKNKEISDNYWKKKNNRTDTERIPKDNQTISNSNSNSNISKDINKKEIEYYSNKEIDKTFKEFLEMRKRIKKPATEKAIELLIKKLSRYSDGVKIKMLENSIVGNRSDVYEIKEEIKNKSPVGYEEGKKLKIEELKRQRELEQKAKDGTLSINDI